MKEHFGLVKFAKFKTNFRKMQEHTDVCNILITIDTNKLLSKWKSVPDYLH